MTTLSDIRASAADALLSQVGVTEDDDPDTIMDYIDECGVTWEPDDFDPSIYWCGYAVGWAYLNIGEFLLDDRCVDIQLQQQIAKNCMGSTSRLAGKLDVKGNPWTDLGLPHFKRVDFEDIEKGDICVVATGRTVREWGDHITIATGSPEGLSDEGTEGDPVYSTVEGNAGDAVIENDRAFSETAIVWRPLFVHLEGAYLEEMRG